MEAEHRKSAEENRIDSYLARKYNTQGPRYTSYPPVPFWNTSGFLPEAWAHDIRSLQEPSDRNISLYIHLPYCESLCTFCACHKRITRNHSVERDYIEAVLTEWNLYLDLMPLRPRLEELHLGGGTPSFFSPENLAILISGILKGAEVSERAVFSFEGHPNNTTEAHLQTLFDLGFRRVSFGVQDYDPAVQKAIHRIQPFEHVERVTQLARNIGYTSVSHDLVFGLPFQTVASVTHTIRKTLDLKPDRIAFYSYAHVPWLKGNGQRGFDASDLPTAPEKRALYETGLELLAEGGYAETGMDHFALPHDELFEAMAGGTLHRNFMGYTASRARTLIGLGVSSISDSGSAFAQNVKDIDRYREMLADGILPLEKGHLMSEEDVFVRDQILNIMCRFETSWTNRDFAFEEKAALMEKLEGFAEDGLITYHEGGLNVTEKGRPYVRNISMAFDRYLAEADLSRKMFSQTV